MWIFIFFMINQKYHKKKELEFIQEEVKKLEKTYKEKLNENENKDLSSYLTDVKEFDTFKYLVVELENKEVPILKTMADNLLVSINEGVVVLVNKNSDSLNLIVRSNTNISAGDLIKKIVSTIAGNGGGSKTFAQGGSKDLTSVDTLKENIEKMIESM